MIVYPLINIIFWGLFATYRLIDDITMIIFNNRNSNHGNPIDEENFFTEHSILKVVDQIFLIIHTFLVSTRGFFFGISFIGLEEKMFGNFFRKCFGIKNEIYTKLEDGNRDNEYNEEEKLEDEEYNDVENNYENDEALWSINEVSGNMKTNANEMKIMEERAEDMGI